MKVTSELIAKYHRNECTGEEKSAVESWLLADGFDDSDMDAPDTISGSDDKAKDRVWKHLSHTMVASKYPKSVRILSQGFQFALAACVILLVLVVAKTHYFRNTVAQPENSLSTSSTSFTIDPLPGTDALVNAGEVEFCGLMRIEVSQDVDLVVNSTCRGGRASETVSLSKGESYIAFNHDFAKENELLIVNVRAIDDLPPLLRRQLNKL